MADGRLGQGVLRGLKGRCPQCGEGRLFRAYLKVEATCPACGHDNGRYPADDAPAYITILLVGHLVVAPVLAFPFILSWPVWLVLGVTLPALAVLTLVLLPRVKGAVIGFHWSHDAEPGPRSEEAAAPPAVEAVADTAS